MAIVQKVPSFTTIKVHPLLSHLNIGDSLVLKNVLVNDFDEKSAKQFYEDMSVAENAEQDIIPIFIDSYGGEVYSLLGMIDCIQASKKKVATIAISKAASCGAILLSCGDEGLRFASQRATIMIHDVSSGACGKIEDIKAKVKNAEDLDDMAFSILDKNCGKTPGYFKSIVHDKGHANWYLTPQEALDLNLVNHIKIPRFNVNVNVEVSFG